MSKELYLLAANKVLDVYSGNCKNNKSTEWNSYLSYYNDKPIQVLAIAGTNDLMDWFWNLCLLSKNGIKYGAVVAAERILESFRRVPGVPLLVCGHSKSTGTAAYLSSTLSAEHCVMFCPIKCYRESTYLPNGIIFLDRDDLVPKVGWSRFVLPSCKTIYLPSDKKWYNIKGKIQDHGLVHIKEYIINNMEA